MNLKLEVAAGIDLRPRRPFIGLFNSHGVGLGFEV
jgi:hypothetical protein